MFEFMGGLNGDDYCPSYERIGTYREKITSMAYAQLDQLNAILVEVIMSIGQMLLVGGFYLIKMRI